MGARILHGRRSKLRPGIILIERISRSCANLTTALLLAAAAAQAADALVPLGATWRYLDSGTDQGAAWRQSGFNDTSWAAGIGQFGFGDGDEATIVNGGASGARYPTIYFRNSFTVTNRSAITNLALRLLRDDGAIVYLNRVEVFRSNMPDAPVTFSTWSAVSVSSPEENTYFSTAIPPGVLVDGTNVLAVEVHQSDPGSSDLSFNAELTANTPAGNLPPVGSITIPATEQIVASNDTFHLNIAATDPETSVTQTELSQDGTLVGTYLTTPVTPPWALGAPGIHEFAARPRDTSGLMSTSPPARVLVTAAGLQNQSVFYPSFAPGNGLILQDGATISSNVLHLTQASTGSRGGAWIPARQNVLQGFVTEFRFRILSKVGGGGDGFCFIIAGTAQPNIGTSISYSGITNSLAVEFDTYQNTSASDPDDHHISVHSRGTLANTSDESASLGLYTPPADFSDGSIHKVKIEYLPGTLRIYLDNFSTPVLTVTVDLATLLSLPNGYAWVGLGAGSGASFEFHDIVTWAFTSYANVPPVVTLTAPSEAMRIPPGIPLSLSATASDPNGQVTGVSFFDGTDLIAQVTNAPYAALWNFVPPGIHAVSALAADNGALISSTAPIVVEVLPANAALTLYPGFSGTAGLILQGTASVATNRLRLTPAATGQVGAAWLDHRQAIQNGFEAVLQFRVTQRSSQGGDGMAFVIQNNASPMLGSSGVNIGYGSIPNSIAIEFDMYQNAQASDPDGNHIGVHSKGTSGNSGDESAALARANPPVLMADGTVHTVLIRYTGGTLRVFLDDLHTALVKLPVDLRSLLGLTDGTAWIGLTASTGAEYENHDVLMWSFRANAAPTIQVRPISGQFVTPTNVTLSADAFDTDGSIAKVEYFSNGSSLGLASAPLFSKAWTIPTAGTFDITAQATDDLDATTTSAPVRVAVFQMPQITFQPASGGGTPALLFATTTGQTYAIQYSTDLAHWTNALPTVTGNGSAIQWQDTLLQGGPQRFYRVVVSP